MHVCNASLGLPFTSHSTWLKLQKKPQDFHIHWQTCFRHNLRHAADTGLTQVCQTVCWLQPRMKKIPHHTISTWCFGHFLLELLGPARCIARRCRIDHNLVLMFSNSWWNITQQVTILTTRGLNRPTYFALFASTCYVFSRVAKNRPTNILFNSSGLKSPNVAGFFFFFFFFNLIFFLFFNVTQHFINSANSNVG